MTGLKEKRTKDRGQSMEGGRPISEDRNRKFAAANPSIGDSDATARSLVVGYRSSVLSPQSPHIALLTGGGDKPYALGLTTALTSAGVIVDFIGSDDHVVRELLANPRVNFFNLRGGQRPQVSRVTKVLRVLNYYFRLICYAAKAKPAIFHILWNNKIEIFDRTLLMLYYKFLGKRLVFTAHNVDKSKRDGEQSFLNRFSLRWQYRLSDHIFVHTEKMKSELVTEFGVAKEKVSVIPFGINNTVPNTSLSAADAKQQLGINKDEKTLLFFGNIAPYKGLEYLVAAFTELSKVGFNYRLIIAGSVKNCQTYWRAVEQSIILSGVSERIIRKIEYVPDEDTEIYFKAADVLVLPYTYVFQSGVLFLGYSFGLPAIAADVGTLKEEIIEGQTGFVFKPQDSSDLAKTIWRYFTSELFSGLDSRRPTIKAYANERNSWNKVANITTSVYANFLGN
jgi:glycosyltransferase involved in cell wall biosynthesis